MKLSKEYTETTKNLFEKKYPRYKVLKRDTRKEQNSSPKLKNQDLRPGAASETQIGIKAIGRTGDYRSYVIGIIAAPTSYHFLPREATVRILILTNSRSGHPTSSPSPM